MQPIILCASERSGTNLLRAVLSSHSAISCPPVTGLVAAMAKFHYKYLALHASHLDEMIADAIELTRLHKCPWDIALEARDIRQRMKSESFWEMYRAVNEIYAEHEGSRAWFSKEPELYDYMYEIQFHIPDAKFICMARDGRDVAASMLKGGLHAYHIYQAAARWKHEQESWLRSYYDPKMRDNIFYLKYEDLIQDPEATLRRLMKFLGLEFEAGQLEFYKNKDVVDYAAKSTLWQNVAMPINSSNTNKYLKDLTPAQIRIFEAVSRDVMKILGYSPVSPVRMKISSLRRHLYGAAGFVLKQIKTLENRGEIRKLARWNRKSREIQNKSFLQTVFILCYAGAYACCT